MGHPMPARRVVAHPGRELLRSCAFSLSSCPHSFLFLSIAEAKWPVGAAFSANRRSYAREI